MLKSVIASFLPIFVSGGALADAKEKRGSKIESKTAEASSEAVPFEGCGRKGSDGKWAELYYNCKGFNGAEFSPPPPCRDGWVKVNEAVSPNLLADLKACVYKL